MLLIPCPWCGQREQYEFAFAGEVDKRRPIRPEIIEDDAWTDYLFGTSNLRGPARYFICHAQGCGMWFTVGFDTTTHGVRDPLPLVAGIESGVK